MPLNVIVNEVKSDTVCVSLDGSLDSNTYLDLEKKVENIPETVKFLIFDMENLQFISSAGLRIVFSTLKRYKARGGKVGVSQMSPNVKKVFEIVQALPSLTVFSSNEEMDNYLAKFQ
ncbi:MAG: STAS domain-containing protein [Cyanobacteria bacterium P01_G01_bin.49]